MPVIAIPRSVKVGEGRRSYTLVRRTDQAGPLPLILAFGGHNQKGSAFRSATGESFDTLVAQGRAVIAYLDSYRGQWNEGSASNGSKARKDGIDDLSYALGVVDELAAEQKADPQQVYAVGFGLGGRFVLRLLHDRPALLRGAMVISATLPAPEESATLGDPARVPVLLMHGTADPFVPYAGGPASFHGLGAMGEGLSSLETAQHFVQARGLALQPQISQPPHLPESDLRAVTVREWGTGTDLVRHYEIAGGGHQVPHPGKQSGTLLFGKTTSDISAAGEFARSFFGA